MSPFTRSSPRQGAGTSARLLLPVLLCIAARVPALGAQSAGPLAPVGTRVRVYDIAGAPITGTVWRIAPDTLSLVVHDLRVHVRVSQLVSVEASAGHDRVGWGLLGAGAGILAGGLLGAATMGQDSQADLGAAGGFVAGGVLGAVAGALIGVVSAPERWRRIAGW
jgi:hypothetical protein